ncbi:MAG: hypothetical protein LAO09_18175 [Acidobacteriia bacterium]|nr:hypothetical protein [Terriglobia bacterium]
MKRATLLITMALCSVLCGAQEEELAPVPDKVRSAKTVFLLNESGSTKLGDAVYREVKTWNRWQVVTDRGKADLLLVVTQRESVEGVVATSSATVTGQTATATSVGVPVKSQSWFLHVVDAKSGDRLWTSNAAMGGKLWRTWNSIAKSLVGDIQKRM